MQITVHLLRAAEIKGLSPGEIVARISREHDDGGFSEVAGVDDIWTSDSMILHAEFLATIEGMDGVPAYLGALVTAIAASDELDLGSVAEAEGTISGSLALATVDRLGSLFRSDQGKSAKLLADSEPADEDVQPDDFVDYFDQWNRVLALAQAQRACVIISQC